LKEHQIEIWAGPIIKALIVSKLVDFLSKCKKLMQINNFIGIDVSKLTLDITAVVDGKDVGYLQIKNTTKEINKGLVGFLERLGLDLESCVFCMEFTGIYTYPLVKWLGIHNARIWMESGIQIKRSSGFKRGKSDKTDSLRIAMYAYEQRQKMKLWVSPRPVIKHIAALLAQRSRLMKCKKQLMTALTEQAGFVEKEILKEISRYNQKPVKEIDKQIKEIEISIKQLVKDDQNLTRLEKLVCSVDGVGFITGIHIIVTTNEFINFIDPRKYACYSGVVPFEHSSGSSIRGKNRVSQMANKNMKTLLHMAALTAIQHNEELREYYKSKIEHKNKMSVINAVRNKLIHRIFACVNQNRLYIKKYQQRLV
jgi:transposase